jgi:hypothetical protein
MYVMFEAGWLRKEKRMVQETTRVDMFNQGKVEWFGPEE